MANCNTIRGSRPPKRREGEGCERRTTRCSSAEIDLARACFLPSPENFCPCQLEEAQRLADNGFETWRQSAVDTASRYLNNPFIDPCFRGYPAFFVGECKCCPYTYVVLGVGCAGCMIFELCQPVREGEGGIFIVRRYGRYC